MNWFLATFLSNGATPRSNHSAVIIGSDMYVYGGWDSSYSQIKDLWGYSVTNQTWQQLFPAGSCPPALTMHTASVVNSDMFIFGGRYISGECSPQLWCYYSTQNSWQQLSDCPVGYWAHTAAVIEQNIYIYGGINGYSGMYCNDLWCYNIQTCVWTPLTGAATARTEHIAVSVGDNLYIHGGSPFGGSNSFNDLWCYNVTSNKWNQLNSSPVGRATHSAVVINSDLYIFGGTDNVYGTTKSNDLWKYNCALDTWTQEILENPPPARANHTATVFDQNMLVFGGLSSSPNAFSVVSFNDLWKVSLVTLSLSDLQVPTVVFAGSTFDISFLVSGQNCNGPAQELISFSGSNQSTSSLLTGTYVYWGKTDFSANPAQSYIYVTNTESGTTQTFNLTGFISNQATGSGAVVGITLDTVNNIIYVLIVQDNFYSIYSGQIANSDTIFLNPVQNWDNSNAPQSIFWDSNSDQLYVLLFGNNGLATSVISGTVVNNIFTQTNTITLSTPIICGSFCVDSIHGYIYYTTLINSNGGLDYNSMVCVMPIGGGNTTNLVNVFVHQGRTAINLTSFYGICLNTESNTLYWASQTSNDTNTQLWQGTISDLSNPTQLLNQSVILQNSLSTYSYQIGMIFYPIEQKYSLTAPHVGGDYPLTISVYVSDFPSISDTVTVQIPVMQLVISDSVAPVPVATGGNYTTSWTASLINKPSDFSTNPIIVNVSRPGGLSSNHKETGQVQDLAPTAVNNYPITITASIDDYSVSDIINLQVKQLKISAGASQTAQYGQSVQLGSSNNPSGISYSWAATSDPINTPSDKQATITALFTSMYSLFAYEPDINQYASDSVTITVIAPINFSGVFITPSQTRAYGNNTVQIGWNIATTLPSPNYRVTVSRSTGTIIWNQYYSGVFSDVISDTAPTTTGVYPYYLTVRLTDYGQASDNATVTLTVIQPQISVTAIPNPTSINDPYLIQWTATAQNGAPSDTLTVTLALPESDITVDCINGVTYSDIFNAPGIISDFIITATASYDNLVGCSASTNTPLKTVLVAVDAGPNQTINYGSSVQIGAGIHAPDITYTWSPSDGLSFSTELHPLASPLETTTYTVTAFREDVNKYASDSVTIYVVAPVNLTGSISPSVSAPNRPITINWDITNEGPAPTLSYYLLIQRSDGSSVVDSDGYTAWSGSVTDTAPTTSGYYPYTITIIRDNFGNTSDQITIPFNVTRVTLTNVCAITNPTPTEDPYLIEWTVNFENPQSNGVAIVSVYEPEDLYAITSDVFSANYLHGQTGTVPAIAPNQESDYQIIVTASDNFGSFHSTAINLRTRFVTVDAGPDQTIIYGSGTTLGLGLQESDITYVWTQTNTLTNPNILNPTAAPLTSTTYTVVASRDFTTGVVKHASDSTTIHVIAPITLSDISLSPSVICATSGDSITISWNIVQSDPYPNYIATVQHPDGGLVWSSDCSGLMRASVTLTPPTTPGSYPYILRIKRTDYGELSDQTTVYLDVVQLSLTATPVTNPVSISAPYLIQWTATALGGQSDDTITIQITPPDLPSVTIPGCISGITYSDVFQAPNAVQNDLSVTVIASYDPLPSCTTTKIFTIDTRAVAVDAGPNQTINYGNSVKLGAGLADPDVTYTWSPNYKISSIQGLFPSVSPLINKTYTVLAYRADINKSASSSTTVTVVAPITISDIQITPNPTAPDTPITITWTLVNQIPSPTLSYGIYVQREDGFIIASISNCSDLTGTVNDTAPSVSGNYSYTVTVTRNNYGQLSDQKTATANVTRVYLSNVKTITNPTPTGDPYLIQWTVNADNPQPHEVITVNVTTPDDDFGITPEAFTALYAVGKTGEMTATAPNSDGSYPITVTAYDDFGSSDSVMISLQTRFVTVDAGSDCTINYGTSTVLGVGLQESDIIYSWTPAYGLSATNILNPVATPLVDTTYTVTATRNFGSGVTKSSTDTVTVTVVSSIEFVNLTLTPSLVSTGQPVQIGWQIITPDPSPHYHLTITRSDGSIVLSSDYQGGFFSDMAIDTSPSTFGIYPYHISAVRYDYGGSSDNSLTNLSVVEANIVTNALPNPTNDSDPFYIQWTASILGGSPSDMLTVTITAPDTLPFVSDCVNNTPYQAIFQAPTVSSDYIVTASASYDLVPACSDAYSFVLYTKRVIVDAGSDRTINYGDSTILGAGIANTDVVYTWVPSDSLNTSQGLNPVATPFTTTTYTVVAFRSDLNRYASDNVTVTVVAPIQVDVEWI